MFYSFNSTDAVHNLFNQTSQLNTFIFTLTAWQEAKGLEEQEDGTSIEIEN